MKKLNLSLSLMALSALVTLVTACGNNTSSISANSDAPGAGALGANVDIKNCQVNQAYTQAYGCLNRNQCAPGSGYSVQANGCVQGQLVTEKMKFGVDAGTRHYGQVTVTNTQQMELLLQSAGLCSASYSGYNATAMTATPCSQWITRGSFLIVKSFTGNVDNINVTIGSGTTFPTDLVSIIPGVYANQLGMVGGFGTQYSVSNYISLNQQAHNYPLSGTSGMQLVGITPDKKLMNLMVVVNSGNLGLDRVDAQIVYQGVQIGTVSLQRF